MAHGAAVMSARSVANVFPSKHNRLLMVTGDCFACQLAPIQGFGPSHCTLRCVSEGSAGERWEEGAAFCLGELLMTPGAPGLRPWEAWPVRRQVWRGKKSGTSEPKHAIY